MATTNQKIRSHSIKQQQDKNNSVISKKLLPPLLLPKTIQAVIKEIQIVDIASNLKHKVSPFWKNIETALAESTLITSLSSRKTIIFYFTTQGGAHFRLFGPPSSRVRTIHVLIKRFTIIFRELCIS